MICAGEIPALPAGYPSEMRQVCGEMMSRQAADRPEMEVIVGRPFVAAVATATDGELCNKNGGLAVYTNIAAVRTFIERFVEL